MDTQRNIYITVGFEQFMTFYGQFQTLLDTFGHLSCPKPILGGPKPNSDLNIFSPTDPEGNKAAIKTTIERRCFYKTISNYPIY